MATTDTNRIMPNTGPPAPVNDKEGRSSLVELRNGKLVIRQKILSFEKMSETMQEIVQFREMLEARIERSEPSLTTIPDEYRPLIAKLSQESDKSLAALSKHIQHELLPAQDEDDEESCKEIQAALPLDAIEKAVKAVATRVNYGLDISRMSSVPVGAKIPVAWQLWRWEVKEECRDWLPKASRDKALVRLAERQQASEDALVLFQTLSESDRSTILSGNSKISVTNLKLTNLSPITMPTITSSDPTRPQPQIPIDLLAPSTPSNTLKRKNFESIDENTLQPEDAESPMKVSKGPGRPKKPADPDKAAKEKERLERKQAKAEKDKKEKEAESRSRNLMASFFGKSKAPAASSSSSAAVIAVGGTGLSPSKIVTSSVSEFEKTFKPFLLKRGASLAPTNWFFEVRAGKTYKGKEKEDNVIVIDDDGDRTPKQKLQSLQDDDDDIQMVDVRGSIGMDLGQMTAQERLQDSFHTLHHRLRPPSLPLPSRRHMTLKSHHPYVVRTVMQKLTEAEVTGSDDSTVRHLLSILRDRTKIPVKVLIFDEDTRPGYFGTWTRNSREVGPRRPFGKDVVSLDYSVDSEAEWEEEEEGDVLDGAEEDNDGDDVVGGDDDSDLDSWLVDDDEPVDPGTPVDERFDSPDFPVLPPLPKRKSKEEEEEPKKPKKRKVVEQLIQFEKGPCWETIIGDCAWEPFKAMRIEFFNDTPRSIDPFKFVAAPVEKLPHPPAMNGSAKYSSHIQPTFAIPTLPDHAPGVASSDPSGVSAKRSVQVPKTSFPEASMPVLLSKIKELNTGSLAVIVEGVYKELNAVIKKNAIEAKIREIGEKSKDGGNAKVWVVKPEVRALYGLLQ